MKPARPALALLVLATLGAIGWSLWLIRDNSALKLQAGSQESARKSLELRAAALESENLDLRRRLEAEGIEAPPAAGKAAPAAHAADAARVESVRALADLQKRFDALQAQMQALQAARSDLEASIESLRADRRRLSTSEAELKDALASSRRVVEAMETELKTKTERIASQEADLRRAKDSNAAGARRTSQVASILSSFEELNRRRENTLASLQRRFRDLTDSYRALALRLDTQRDSQAPIQITSGEVSRISEAVQSAEDELRQINTMNAESQRLTRRLQN
jgi:chromosome segregation ATPase